MKTFAPIEILEPRIAPATLFVGKTSNYTITSDVAPAGLSAGDTVTFVPDAGSSHGTRSNLIFGTTAFTDLGAGLSGATSGDTLRVATGAFNGPFTISKSVTLLGDHATKDARTGRTNASDESTISTQGGVVTIGAAVKLDGFRFDTGSSTSAAMKISAGFSGNVATIVNDIFVGSAAIDVSNSVSAGSIVRHNRIDVAGTGILFSGSVSDFTVEENHIAVGTNVAGINFSPTSGSGENIIIRGNQLVGANPAVAGNGVFVGGGTPATTSLIVRENFINNFGTGVRVLGPLPVQGFVTVRANDLHGDGLAINSSATATLDAPFNYYGAAADTAAEVDALITGNADFQPFALTVNASDNVADRDQDSGDGFQPRLELAVAVTGQSFTYPDADGDTVKVTVSTGTLDPLVNLAFDAPTLGKGLVLEKLILDASSAGANVTATVQRGPAGDGFVNIGLLQSPNDLGKVSIRGDLGVLNAGDSTPETPAVVSLKANSFGRGGVPVFVGGKISNVSTVLGRVATFAVAHDFGGNLHLTGSAGRIDTLTIGGSLTAVDAVKGSGLAFGQINADSGFGAVTILGDIRGGDNIAGPALFETPGSVKSLVVKGSLTAGGSGGVGDVEIGSAMRIQIGGGIGVGERDGRLLVDRSVGTLTVGGSISGSAVIGGAAGKVTIGGDIAGNSNFTSGQLEIDGAAGPVRILGSIIGGGSLGGLGSGGLTLSSTVKQLSIFGSVRRSVGGGAGFVSVGDAAGPVFIGGDIDAGEVTVSDVASLTVGGSVIGDDGGSFGSINVARAGNVLIRGSIIAGSGFLGGSFVAQKGVASFKLLGDFVSTDTSFSQIAFRDRVGSVFIGGDVIGTAISPALIAIDGEAQPATATDAVAVQTLTIRGSLDHAQIRVGGSVNPDASAGLISIGGNVVASSITAGIDDGGDNQFGTADDTVIAPPFGSGFTDKPSIVATIAKLVIGGALNGTDAKFDDHFGIEAQHIGSITIGGVALPLDATQNDDFTLGNTGDVRVRELP